jgi:hypothetical protein
MTSAARMSQRDGCRRPPECVREVTRRRAPTMARYKLIATDPNLVPIDLAAQLLPGTFENASTTRSSTRSTLLVPPRACERDFSSNHSLGGYLVPYGAAGSGISATYFRESSTFSIPLVVK